MDAVFRLVASLSLFTAATVAAQTAAPALSDTAETHPNAVTAYAIRSGKLMLSSRTNPEPVSLPDGTYKNQSDLIVVIMNGRVTRIQETTDRITEISSMRLNRQKLVTLMPSTNALMAVNELLLPSGTFTSEDGKTSFTIVFGRPTAFTLSGGG
jgi:hypothetical protein